MPSKVSTVVMVESTFSEVVAIPFTISAVFPAISDTPFADSLTVDVMAEMESATSGI